MAINDMVHSLSVKRSARALSEQTAIKLQWGGANEGRESSCACGFFQRGLSQDQALNIDLCNFS
jgi:hypothetical protein